MRLFCNQVVVRVLQILLNSFVVVVHFWDWIRCVMESLTAIDKQCVEVILTVMPTLLQAQMRLIFCVKVSVPAFFGCCALFYVSMQTSVCFHTMEHAHTRGCVRQAFLE